MVHILYLTFDLNDAATWRRVATLRMGGASVSLAGFHRGSPPPPRDGIHPVALGETFNGRMGRRALSVARAAASVVAATRPLPPPDIVLARNLEALALTPRLRGARGGRPPRVVYECLDIHRMMLGQGLRARTLRMLERRLLARSDLVLTSSPGFVRNYFAVHHPDGPAVEVIENKVLPGAATGTRAAAPPAPPFRLGWFGILRCSASLAWLDALTRARPGLYEVDLRGRPALDAVPGFHDTVAANPAFRFHGPYDAGDLPAIYGDVHFSWLVDRFEAGQNSDWLLPNRLYEGGAFGAVPIALAGTETARFLERHGLGLTLPDATPGAVIDVLGTMTPERQAALAEASRGAPADLWSLGPAECGRLVARMGGEPGASATFAEAAE
jgi:succinoglycan biosynthesis protein ExoL